MDLISRDDLQELAARQHTVAVSCYIPTERVGAKQSENTIRFKNAIKQVESHLEETDVSDADRSTMVESLRERLNDSSFNRGLSDGVALFCSPDSLVAYRVPLSFGEFTTIGSHFHLKPLFPLIASNNVFYLLALSQNNVRLFQGTHHAINQVQHTDIPESLQEALFYDDPERSLQHHTGNVVGGRHDASFHGQGVQDEDQRRRPKDALRRFFHDINEGICEALEGETAPLLLAGVEYYLPIYTDVNDYPNLVTSSIVAGSPDNTSVQTLHERAWDIVEPIFLNDQDEAKAKFVEQINRNTLASSDLREILPAATFGRVDTLFVPIGRQQWGTYDPDSNTAEMRDTPSAGDVDLLNYAAIQTYLHGGTVHALRPENMPEDAGIGALFRYPANVEAEVESSS